MKNKGCLISFFIVTFLGIGLVVVSFMFMGFNSNNKPVFSADRVAVVKIEGPIFEVDDLLKDLEEFRKSPSVKAVVVRVNSPGGAVGPSQEVYRQILKLRDSGKKVIISMGTLAASGGYYIACAGDKIVANSGTITGSIGVIMENFGLAELLDTMQLELRTFKSGKYKDAGSPFREMKDFEKKYLQSLVDNMYEIFIDDIAKARKMPREKVAELAQGKIYTGRQAQQVGLVDEIGNLYDAIALAKKEAGLPDDALVSWPKKPSPFEAFFEQKAMMHYLQKIMMWTSFQGLPTWSMGRTTI